ncbi:hypothetical protein BASA81_003576 [Batrachochytrium salamandrivorans]|nr:hypothetical protein BASA81_003576 [Batrachochytrium salamandrivorans]
MSQDAHHHHHAHGDHGHSHRSGAAARYWREPKPVAVTVMCFLGLLVFTWMRSSSPLITGSKGSIEVPGRPPFAVWQQQPGEETGFVRDLAGVDTSCEFRSQLAASLYRNELDLLRYVSCFTIECVWAMDVLLFDHPDIPFVVPPQLLLSSKLLSIARPVHSQANNLAPFSGARRESFPEINCQAAFPLPVPTLSPPSAATSCDDSTHVFRPDLKLCLPVQLQCEMLTAKACTLPLFRAHCQADCEYKFAKELHADLVLHQTMVLCLITLFMLG